MHRAENWESIFIDTFWRGLEQGAPFVIGFLAAIWLLGYISRRLIQRQPEFSLKHEMQRGVWWFPTEVTALVVLSGVLAYVGIKYTDYPLSFMVTAVSIAALLLHFADRFIPKTAFLGWAALFYIADRHLKQETVNWDELAALQQHRRNSRAFKIVVVFTYLVMVGAPVFLLTQYTVPADQMFAGMRQLSRLEERVTDRLQNPLVTVVVVGGPPMMDERRVIIRVKKEASEQQIEEVRDQARQVIAQLDPEHVWEVLVAREREDDHRPSRSPPHPRN